MSTPPLPKCREHIALEVLPSPEIGGSNFLTDAVDGRLRLWKISDGAIQIADFDPATHVWQTFEISSENGKHAFRAWTTGRELAEYADESDGLHLRVYDLQEKRWRTDLRLPVTSGAFFAARVDDGATLFPSRACGFFEPESIVTIEHGVLRSTPSSLSVRRGPRLVVVENRVILFGGNVNRDAPRGSDVDCKSVPDGPPTNDGAVLDLQTGTWTAMAIGPPASDYRAEVASHFMFVWTVGTKQSILWRYDVTVNAWQQIGPLPAGFARTPSWDEPVESIVVGSSFVLVHAGTEPAIAIVDLQTGTLRETKMLPIVPGAVAGLDEQRILVVPRSVEKQTAYVDDLTTGTWCELDWQFGESWAPYYVFMQLLDGKLVAWGPNDTSRGFVGSLRQ